MATQRKLPACALILILAISSIMMIESAAAQQATSFTPEFSVKLVDNSYTIPAKYATDPYTGEQKLVQGGDYVENKSVIVTIKNQPFTPYTDSKGNQVNVYYGILWKGHYEERWPRSFSNDTSYKSFYPQNNTGGNTVVSFLSEMYIPDQGQLDFKVQAFVGYYKVTHIHEKAPLDWNIDRNYRVLGIPPPEYYDYDVYTFIGKGYDWSSVQTLSLPNGEMLTTPTPMESQLSNTLGNLAIGSSEINPVLLALVVFISVIAGVVLVLGIARKFRRKNP